MSVQFEQLPAICRTRYKNGCWYTWAPAESADDQRVGIAGSRGMRSRESNQERSSELSRMLMKYAIISSHWSPSAIDI